ncbi:MAG: hypothetical protein A2039_00750 [Candidatus Melainabacteria bacterium GWA2_34_9]|nr:MAG: hypothetical protein A2039_00750 [Candidatus Melainabacteria bacterium GWA2_34_9]
MRLKKEYHPDYNKNISGAKLGMDNKIFSIIAVGVVVNSIIISFCTICYTGFMNYSSPLTHISKGNSVININGY